MTVDYGALTTNAQAIANLNISSTINTIMLLVISVFTAIKHFFPNVDKH
nr:MAG: hypothetical protein [Microviridae sp.]WAE43778.1 MAG: hypothetical protein [Microviridae sp.]